MFVMSLIVDRQKAIIVFIVQTSETEIKGNCNIYGAVENKAKLTNSRVGTDIESKEK